VTASGDDEPGALRVLDRLARRNRVPQAAPDCHRCRQPADAAGRPTARHASVSSSCGWSRSRRAGDAVGCCRRTARRPLGVAAPADPPKHHIRDLWR
jgi:hypothetical protein